MTLGLIAGFFKQFDAPIARLIDAMMAFPDILLAIALVAALGPSLTTVIIALSIGLRTAPGAYRSCVDPGDRELPYIEAARALGISTRHHHYAACAAQPAVADPGAGDISLCQRHAGRSGTFVSRAWRQPEIPTWGTMISAGRPIYRQADWMTLFPGFAIILSVLSLQMVGDGLRRSSRSKASKGLMKHVLSI